jgi:acyl-CoA synthetase (AMP-forming)/AMP-acid ligase II
VPYSAILFPHDRIGLVEQEAVLIHKNGKMPGPLTNGRYLGAFTRPNINLDVTAVRDDEVRTFPELIDFNARENPDHTFCIQATKQAGSTSLAFNSITFSHLKDGILQCCAWLEANVSEMEGPKRLENASFVKGAPVALFMESDVGLFIHQISLISLGVPVLLLSARLSPTAVHHLLKKTGACAIIVSPRLQGTAGEALAVFGEIQSRPKLYQQTPYKSFLTSSQESTIERSELGVPGHYIDENDRDVLILHSSGTTGLPKPIYTSHRHMLCFVNCHAFDDWDVAQGLNLSTLPLYHGFGLVTPALSLGVGKACCFPPPNVIPTGSSVLDDAS